MNVGKIFKVLIIVVGCVLVGAFILNLLLPNVTTTLIDSVEDMLFRTTGMSFDFNGNQIVGGRGALQYQGQNADGDGNATQGNVDGFKTTA